jgi:hypothetical protein
MDGMYGGNVHHFRQEYDTEDRLHMCVDLLSEILID